MISKKRQKTIYGTITNTTQTTDGNIKLTVTSPEVDTQLEYILEEGSQSLANILSYCSVENPHNLQNNRVPLSHLWETPKVMLPQNVSLYGLLKFNTVHRIRDWNKKVSVSAGVFFGLLLVNVPLLLLSLVLAEPTISQLLLYGYPSPLGIGSFLALLPMAILLTYLGMRVTTSFLSLSLLLATRTEQIDENTHEQ